MHVPLESGTNLCIWHLRSNPICMNVAQPIVFTQIFHANCSRTRHQVVEESSIFSRLAQHFPFIFNLLRKNRPQSPVAEDSYFPKDPSFSAITAPDSGKLQNEIPADRTAEDFDIYSTELQAVLSKNGGEMYYWRCISFSLLIQCTSRSLVLSLVLCMVTRF